MGWDGVGSFRREIDRLNRSAPDLPTHLLLLTHLIDSISNGIPILVCVVLHRCAEPRVVAVAPHRIAGRGSGPGTAPLPLLLLALLALAAAAAPATCSLFGRNRRRHGCYLWYGRLPRVAWRHVLTFVQFSVRALCRSPASEVVAGALVSRGREGQRRWRSGQRSARRRREEIVVHVSDLPFARSPLPVAPQFPKHPTLATTCTRSNAAWTGAAPDDLPHSRPCQRTQVPPRAKSNTTYLLQEALWRACHRCSGRDWSMP